MARLKRGQCRAADMSLDWAWGIWNRYKHTDVQRAKLPSSHRLYTQPLCPLPTLVLITACCKLKLHPKKHDCRRREPRDHVPVSKE
jgi:hypothetical protein